MTDATPHKSQASLHDTHSGRDFFKSALKLSGQVIYRVGEKVPEAYIYPYILQQDSSPL